MPQTFLSILREAARGLPLENPNKLTLMHAADELAGRVGALSRECTHDNARRFNGAWVHAERVLDAVKNPKPPGGAPAVDDLSDLLGTKEEKVV